MKTIKKIVKRFISWISENNFWQFALLWETSAAIVAIVTYGSGRCLSIWEGVLVIAFPLLAQICLPVVFFLLALGMSVAECFNRHEAKKN